MTDGASRKGRITLVISSLSSGGAERVMSMLANRFHASGWDTTLLTLDGLEDGAFYPLDVGVKVEPLNLMGKSEGSLNALGTNFRRILRLRSAIARGFPDVVLSFMDTTNILTLFASIGLDTKVVVSERTDPAMHRLGMVWTALRWFIYHRAERIVVQTPASADYFVRKFRNKLAIIPNAAVSSPRTGHDSPEASICNLVVGIGRLTQEKGFDLLIRAFAIVSARCIPWKLVIHGEGPCRGELERMIRNFALQERVFLPGRTSDAFGELAKASIFVMPSRYEGFPNALCEAMASGKAVIASDCAGGAIRDILESGESGVLVPVGDVQTLAGAMENLMGDEKARVRLGMRARRITERFHPDEIFMKWEKTLKEAVAHEHNGSSSRGGQSGKVRIWQELASLLAWIR